MNLPNRQECLDLMVQVGMPHHIQQHSIKVADVAVSLSRKLNEQSFSLNIALIEASSLVHDIGKAKALETKGDHGKIGADMITELGYPALAPIVGEHIVLYASQLEQSINETLIVNYSDKRVKHDTIVCLQDRFDDLALRYGKNIKSQKIIRDMLKVYQDLENRIFSYLEITPSEL